MVGPQKVIFLDHHGLWETFRSLMVGMYVSCYLNPSKGTTFGLKNYKMNFAP